ncbi:MAG: hypothetical protein ACI31B_04010, partial [Muribaculaceae bacterium]
YKKPIPTKYFRNFFSRIFRKNPQNITYQPFTPPKFLCSTTHFPHTAQRNNAEAHFFLTYTSIPLHIINNENETFFTL